jgi:ABC-type Fe3+/spermidine/putrescine transport system ATPase subunit
MKTDDKICFAVRPERIKLQNCQQNGYVNIAVNLKERTYIGSIIKTIVTLSNGGEIIVNEPANDKYVFVENDSSACISWNPENAVVMKS